MKFPFLPFAALALAFLPAFPSAHGEGGDTELRGERVGWARLKTESTFWLRHATGDPSLMMFFRENTSLNIDPTWYAADVKNLREMSKYPLLFSQGIQVVNDEESRKNLTEYVRRGGFLLIDACINRGVNPDPDLFLIQQKKMLETILPEARVIPLPRSHAIYQIYFQIPNGEPPHTFFNNIYDEQWKRHGLYGIALGSRLAGIISLSGLQCGWDRMVAPPGHDTACMRMLVNIYIYAMLQGN